MSILPDDLSQLSLRTLQQFESAIANTLISIPYSGYRSAPIFAEDMARLLKEIPIARARECAEARRIHDDCLAAEMTERDAMYGIYS